MSGYRTELGQVVYEASSQSYRARVTFREGPDTESFDCTLRFPVDTGIDAVTAALVRQAKELRQRRRTGVTRSLMSGSIDCHTPGFLHRTRGERRRSA